VKFELPQDPGGATYLLSDVVKHLGSAILVYGTVQDAGANRYAAEQLQTHFLDYLERAVPIRKDFEVTGQELRQHDVIFVGRPETNSALAQWAERLGIQYEGGDFRIANADHASEREALVLAAPNPLDDQHMICVLAGNSALETVKLVDAAMPRTEYAVFRSGKEVGSGFVR